MLDAHDVLLRTAWPASLVSTTIKDYQAKWIRREGICQIFSVYLWKPQLTLRGYMQAATVERALSDLLPVESSQKKRAKQADTYRVSNSLGGSIPLALPHGVCQPGLKTALT